MGTYFFIEAAIEDYKKGKEAPPNNLFKYNLSDLIDLGYKKLNSKDEILDGDIIVASDKDKDLFIRVDNAKELRKALKRPTIFSESLIVYRKC